MVFHRNSQIPMQIYLLLSRHKRSLLFRHQPRSVTPRQMPLRVSTGSDWRAWLTTYATAEFKKGGEHAFYFTKKGNLGPFRQTHVSVLSLLVRRVELSLLTFMFATDVHFKNEGWNFQDTVSMSFALQVLMHGLSLIWEDWAFAPKRYLCLGYWISHYIPLYP
jgi:hypothetical protein